MPYDVFISYSRKDKKTVTDFCTLLDNANITYWLDKKGIETGDNFKTIIVKAIEASNIFLFFASKDSNISPWTAKEIGIAVARNKPIIPIRLDHSLYNKAVEFDLVNLDFMDFTTERNRIDKSTSILNVIKKHLNDETNKEIIIKGTTSTKRYYWLYACIALIISLTATIFLQSKDKITEYELKAKMNLAIADSIFSTVTREIANNNGTLMYDSINIQAINKLLNVKQIYNREIPNLQEKDSIEYTAKATSLIRFKDSCYKHFEKKYNLCIERKAPYKAQEYKEIMERLKNIN